LATTNLAKIPLTNKAKIMDAQIIPKSTKLIPNTPFVSTSFNLLIKNFQRFASIIILD
jgi:hypothetical protein